MFTGLPTLRKATFHPAQRVLLAAAETDTVGCVERSMSFDEVVPLQASHPLQSVNILIEQKHKYQYIHRDSLGAPSCSIPVSSIASGVLYPSAAS